jgi:hypothetical protein
MGRTWSCLVDFRTDVAAEEFARRFAKPPRHTSTLPNPLHSSIAELSAGKRGLTLPASSMWRSKWGSSWAMRRARHRGAAHPPIWGHIVGKRSGGPTSHANLLCRARVWLVQQGVRPRRAFPLPSSERGSAIEAPIMLRPRNVAASRGSSRRLGARCGPVALLLLAALAPATAVGQCAPQPVFTELFAYDPAVPSQLLGSGLAASRCRPEKI